MSRVTLELRCCSFCGDTEHLAEMLVAGPNDLFICDVCIEECMNVLLQRRIEKRAAAETKEG